VNRLWSFLSQFPAWSVVLSVAGLIGALSAILAVLLYRDIAESDTALSIPSKSSDRNN
jgi:uncharacterized BrkB/YihY/UPF0761 family membrane protein